MRVLFLTLLFLINAPTVCCGEDKFEVIEAPVDGAGLKERADELRFAVVPIPVGQIGNLVTNANRTRQAFSVYFPGAEISDRLFVTDLTSHEALEITGIPLPHRPISNLTWETENIVVFERWSQPHYGWRYKIDCKAKKLVGLMNLFDKLFQQDGSNEAR